MGLEVAPPEPPELSSVDPNTYDDATVVTDPEETTDSYHRDDIQQFFADGAWEEAFEQWRQEADIDTRQYQIILDLDLFSEFDFFWDDFADRVGYHAPGIPEDWREREIHPALDSWGTVSGINAELTEFGQIVCEILKEEYIDWEAEYEPPDDLPDF